MRNITGPAVTGEDLFGRKYEIDSLWQRLDRGEHVLMLAPRRIGKTSLMRELLRDPRPNWHAVYIDVQAGDAPEDLFAAILASLSEHPNYRTWLEAIPFRTAVANVLARIREVELKSEALAVEFKAALRGDWQHTADQLRHRLASPPDQNSRLVLLIDELPFLVSRALKKPDGKEQMDLLLSKLRELRQWEALSKRVVLVVTGSIGLETVVRRVGLSASVADFSLFPVESWHRETAKDFLRRVGENESFPLAGNHIDRMLDLLGDLVPYHVQLFFAAVQREAKGHIENVSDALIEATFHDRLAGPSGTPHLDHYAERLAMLVSQAELDLARTILGKACSSRTGIARGAIGAEEDRDPELFRSVLRLLQSDGYLTHDETNLRFRSNLLRDWWRRQQAPRARP